MAGNLNPKLNLEEDPPPDTNVPKGSPALSADAAPPERKPKKKAVNKP